MKLRHAVVLSLSLSMLASASAGADTVLRFAGVGDSNPTVLVKGSTALPTIPAGAAKGDNQVGTRKSEWRSIGNPSDGEPYGCSGLFPDAGDIDQGVTFMQTGNCLVDVQSERDVFYVYGSGKELFANKEFSEVAETVVSTQQAVGERHEVSRKLTGQTSRITTFCVGFNNPSRHYKSTRSFYDVYTTTYSNGDTEQETQYRNNTRRTFWTDDRSECIAGTQGL